MSENKRKMVKVTIEAPNGDTQIFEAHGIAAVTVEDKGDRYSCRCALVGDMSVPDLLALREAVEEDLVEGIDQTIGHYSKKHPLGKILAALRGN